MSNPHSSPTHRVAIVGAGFAGLCMAIKLKQAGIDDFVILERASAIGGTWRENTYPGCACDVPSHLYSYSFELNAEWSRVFAPWQEIEAYLQHCVEKYGLGPHLRLDTAVRELRFDDTAQRWTIALEAGTTILAGAVVVATGPLNKPDLPALPGLGDFGGEHFHSSRWNHACDLRGKRVAIVGTGASAIQIVPAIASEVEHLLVFQRTPPWVLPRFDRRYSAAARRLLRSLPLWRRLCRWTVYWRLEQFGFALLKNGLSGRLFAALGRRQIRRQIADPRLREKVAPTYRLGCKRVLLSDDYYPSLARNNVEVITEDITSVTTDGLRTADGREHPSEVIIYATGFRATDFLTPLRIFNGRGEELAARWQDGAASYLGISTAGFPNLYLLVGPNTGLGHNSIIFMIEAQVHYVMDALRVLHARGLTSAEIRKDVESAFTAELQRRLQGTAWLAGCKSWYLSGDGRNFTMWPGFTVEYWRRTRRFEPARYHLR